jgi:hypothetical protein
MRSISASDKLSARFPRDFLNFSKETIPRGLLCPFPVLLRGGQGEKPFDERLPVRMTVLIGFYQLTEPPADDAGSKLLATYCTTEYKHAT